MKSLNKDFNGYENFSLLHVIKSKSISPSDEAILNEMNKYIKLLSKRENIVFERFFLENETVEDISKEIGCKQLLVRLMINSITRKLKRKFNAY